MSTRRPVAKEPGKEFDALRPPELNAPIDPLDIDLAHWSKKSVKTSEANSAEAKITAVNSTTANIAAAVFASALSSAAKVTAEDVEVPEIIEEVKPKKAEDKLLTEARLQVRLLCKQRKEDMTAQRDYLQMDRFFWDVLVPAINYPAAALMYAYLYRQTYGQKDNKTKSYRIGHKLLAAKIAISMRTCADVIHWLCELRLIETKGKEREVLEYFVKIPWIRGGETFPTSAAKITAADSTAANSASVCSKNYSSPAANSADDYRDLSSEIFNQRNLSQGENEFPIQFVWRWEEMKKYGISSKRIQTERETFKILYNREKKPFWDHAYGVIEDMFINGDKYGQPVRCAFSLLNHDRDNWAVFFSRYRIRLQNEGHIVDKPDLYACKTEAEIRAEVSAAVKAQFG